MPNVLITGANRGLGLGLTQLYLADGWQVRACCRFPAEALELQELLEGSEDRLSIHLLDLENLKTVEAIKDTIGDDPIDVLLNVAGYYGPIVVSDPGGLQVFGTTDYDVFEKTFRVNVIGPMKMCETFVENVAFSDHKKMITISSIAGSIGENKSGKLYPYRASKVALNAIMKSMSIELKNREIIAAPLHPGWVRTDMGGPLADIDADTSVAGIKSVIDGMTMAHSGRYLVYDGSELPW